MGKFNFTPKQWVLVRDEDGQKWALDIFSYLDDNEECIWYNCIGGLHLQCIPYDGNEHLLNTTDDYVEPWQPKDGDFIVCEKKEEGPKSIFIFKGWNGDRVKMYCIRFYSDLRPIVGLDEREFSSYKGFLRKATDSETSDFLAKLAEIGKKWNPEKKCIEDAWTPKDGDFVSFCKSCIAIFKGFNDVGALDDYVTLFCNDGHLNYGEGDWRRDDLRPATDSEKQQLLDALHKEGKDWDESKKEIVEYRWKPKEGEDYWMVCDDGTVLLCPTYDPDSESDANRIEIGNCFQTEEEANPYADKFKKLFKKENNEIYHR